MNVLSILGLPESVGLGILALGAALVLAAALGEVKIGPVTLPNVPEGRRRGVFAAGIIVLATGLLAFFPMSNLRRAPLETGSTPSSSPPPVQDRPVNVTGSWKMNVNFVGYMGFDGLYRNQSGLLHYFISLRQDGERLEGELNGGPTNPASCTRGDISGTVVGQDVRFDLHYKGCPCEGGKAIFEGLVTGKTFRGKIRRQAALPPTGCGLFDGDVVGSLQ
jgi:hypothetical protein